MDLFDDLSDFNTLPDDNEEPEDFGNQHQRAEVYENRPAQDEDDNEIPFKNIRLRQDDDLIDRRCGQRFLNFDTDEKPPWASKSGKRKHFPTTEIDDDEFSDGDRIPHPIDWHENWEHGMSKEEKAKAKKARLESEYLDRLMAKIEETKGRKFAEAGVEENEEEFSGGNSPGKSGREGRGIFTFIPQNAGNWIRVSSPDNERHFYVVTNFRRTENFRDFFRRNSDSTNFLLGKNFQDLLEEAQGLRMKKNVNTEMEMSIFDRIEAMESEKLEGKAADKDLWVEKYKPRLFIDLLSDDGINRTLLTWLKLWDECVFGRKIPGSQKVNNKSLSEQSTIVTKLAEKRDTKFRKRKFAKNPDADELSTELDNHKRPEYKVALLSGPPGMGKTTLANVIARVAGYHVVELNASDDRTLDHFKTALEGSTQMKATLDSHSRPNCLVIDEIDGAPSASINYLVNLVRGEAPGGGMGKNKGKKILKRPVICICNDLYVPALRELRKHALVLPFPQTSTQRLKERLQYVCRQENMTTDNQTLEALCDKTCQDIRACLNTIQFASSKTLSSTSAVEAEEEEEGSSKMDIPSEKRLTLNDVKNSSLGQKDAQKTLFNVWHQIFELPKIKGKMHLGQMVTDENAQKEARSALTPAGRFETIHKVVSAAEEREKLRQGIFDNYLNINTRESSLSLVTVGLSWFLLVDELNTMVAQCQVYELWRYVNFLPVMFHLLFAASGYLRIEFPHSHYEAWQKQQKSANILKSVTEGCDVQVVENSDGESLVTEVLPYICDIIQPNLKPVNLQLYSGKDKVELKQVVDVMLAYSLAYRQQRSGEGTYDFVLEPSVDELVTFVEGENKNSNTKQKLSYSAKQMICREVELERVRKTEKFCQREHNSGANREGNLKRANQEHRPEDRNQSKKALPTKNHLQFLKAKPFFQEAECDKTPRMFFGAKIGEKKKEVERVGLKKKDGGVWFKFNEGYSNAVRRNIKMKDLWK